MNRLRSMIGLVLTMVFLSAGAWAASSTYKPKFKFDAQKDFARYSNAIKYLPVPTGNTTLFADPKEYEKALEFVHGQSRRVAMVKTDITAAAVEAELSPKFKEMRKTLIGDEKNVGLKNKEALDKIVEQYSKPEIFEKITDPDAKFLAFQLRGLRPAKSFIFRAREYIKKNSASKTMIVSALRAQISGITNLFPAANDKETNYAEIVFQYVTEPFPDMEEPITEDEHLHMFFQKQAQFVENEVKLFQEFAFKKPEFWWDTQLYAPYANFINEKDRYIKIGYSELLAVYSAALLNLSGLYSMTAYSFTGLSAAIQETSGYFGVDAGALFNKLGAEGLSSKNKFNVLTEQTPFLFTNTEQTEYRMRSALVYLISAVQAAVVAYEDVRGRSADDVRFFESRFVTPSLRGSDNSVRGLANLLGVVMPNEISYGKDSTAKENKNLALDKVKKTVHSAVVDGDVIKVDLVGFYTNPPKNLSDLYPKRWLTDVKKETKVKSWNGKDDVLRNYKYEMATDWDATAWQKLFPELKPVNPNAATTQELGKYIRVLSQTWGTSAFAVPLTYFVF